MNIKGHKTILLAAIALAMGVVWDCCDGATPKRRALRVACIGDSITYGFGLADRDRESYPAQLQRMLNKWFPRSFEVRNFGSSGRGIYLDSMRGAEKRGYRWTKEHKAALEWKPDIVVCNLGINDCGEYIKEFTGGRERGQLIEDYLALLLDYSFDNPYRRSPARRSPAMRKIYLWSKLAPLAEKQRFHRSPEPFLMQRDIEYIAGSMSHNTKCQTSCIDLQEPLREKMDEIFAHDGIHPNAEGAGIIAETVFKAIIDGEARGRSYSWPSDRLELPDDVRERCETWLCAGQSNMQKGWGEFNATPEEKARVKCEMARLAKVDVRFWDFNDGSWTKLTPTNALNKCAFGVSFAIRRAEATGKAVAILYVAAGGAPTESFLSEATMCAIGKDGKPLYPHLAAIATNRHRLDQNKDFPCKWVAREYPRRRGNSEEARWWPVSMMYGHGIRRIKDCGIKVDGILWYQGESNATANVAPDVPLADDYMLETNLAIIDQLRGERKIPFLMIGLPKMNRPWEPYRAAQRKACEEKGAIYVDTFAAGLGDERDVHPRDKIPFAELALRALD